MGEVTRGRFITIEGGEGAGKSTQMALAVETLRAAGFRVIATREPGGTPLAEQIRALVLARRDETVAPACELLLMSAARAQHVHTLIAPALARGDWVVCDRFVDATHAYQGAGRGVDANTIDVLSSVACAGLSPDLTLLFDLPIERGLARAGARGAQDRFEQERIGFHERVRATYLARARSEPRRVRVVDAARSREEVAEDVQALLRAFIAEVTGER